MLALKKVCLQAQLTAVQQDISAILVQPALNQKQFQVLVPLTQSNVTQLFTHRPHN
jgi:hypothetical protein